MSRPRTRLAALALTFLACQPTGGPPAPKQATAPAPAQKAPTEVNPKLAAPPVVPATPEPAAPKAEAASEGPEIKVLHPGAEPRQPLRLALQAGQTQSMVMTLTMALGMEIGGRGMPKVAIPPMQMTMNLDVKDVSPAGEIRTDFVLAEVDVLPAADVLPATADAMKAMLAGMRNISGSSTVTSRGIGRSAEFKLPPDINPQIQQTMDSMRQQISQLSVPFPEEALGVGARWTVTQKLAQQGTELAQVATWELVSREGNVVKLANSLIQNAAPQPMKPPGLPPGASVMLEALDSKGRGDVELDLTRLAPIKSHVDLTMQMKMVTTMLGQNTASKMDMTLGVDIAGR